MKIVVDTNFFLPVSCLNLQLTITVLNAGNGYH